MADNLQRMLLTMIGVAVLAYMIFAFSTNDTPTKDDDGEYQQTIELIKKTNEGRAPKY